MDRSKNIFWAFLLFVIAACQPDAEEAPPPPAQDFIVWVRDMPLSQTFPSGGGRTTLSFSSSGPWTASPAEASIVNWCRIAPTEGIAGEGRATVTVLPNTTPAVRTAIVTVRTGKAERSVTLTQQPSDVRACSEEEVRRFLEKLYRDTDGDNWRFKDHWCSDRPLSEWGPSVKYADGKLELILGENNLRGKIDLSGCTALVSLRCAKNALTSLDVSGCPLLTQVDCTNCGIAELNLSGCYSLERILCGYNDLTRIDLSDCPYLKSLTTPRNRLNELDISSCSGLDEINCAENRLKTLDVAGRQPLRHLFCYGNELTELDLSGCSSLTLLNCGSNRLTELNLSGCRKLGRLYCYDNRIGTLDLSDCKNELAQLHCPYNRLSRLDVAAYRRLSQLDCSHNDLREMDLSDCVMLGTLYCSDNDLHDISLAGCTMLSQFDCSRNSLRSIDVSVCRHLSRLLCSDNAILSEIPESFDRLTVFEHDIRYEYRTERDETTGKETTTAIDRKTGWWYPGEPEKGSHSR